MQDAIYRYNEEEQKQINNKKPWKEDVYYFKEIRISAIALIKMVMHARSGGSLEIMGLMQGKIVGNEMIVMDAFALPVEGTETRVNAQAEGYEYMVEYNEKSKQVGRMENVIGWYHSHPGYGCWLSGIDVSTQMLNQKYQEPFVAVVIDPNRTMSAGKVEIGAFRTFPEDYTPDDKPSEYQTIPLNKIEDFGIHCKRYYSLNISYFKSELDTNLLASLWNKYWINTLSSSSLLTNREYNTRQISDLAEKIEQEDFFYNRDKQMGDFPYELSENDSLQKIAQDSSKIAIEVTHGLLTQVLKDIIFNKH
ncbi:hypothetical protein BCR32DRAFT_215826 [Anaeromyces robustus]|uniref:COP9 signalosome complex subunit 5 n=1 Tax=Anaeromyces robustus TaxID=1754192 RepID=A0A1Y1XMI0_9FUNG|nr:hypothetical protein BCR32DRAFT_215826 [Anaeromyces robustus]|eukprot:ORX86932.1 hypothetical protein BCR32DRAFT_215826 [Anaeromyces robustus]